MIRCFKCKGRGYVRGKVDWLSAVFTLGMTALVDASERPTCDACQGRGYLEDGTRSS